MNTRDRPQVEWGTSVTIPLLDEEGYPRPLRHVRHEVEARGGRIEGTARDWIITHPARPSFHLRFHDDGYVALWFPCSEFDVPVPHDLTWGPEHVWAPCGDGPGADLGEAIRAILNGGYRETLTENDQGVWRNYEWALDGGESGRALNPAEPDLHHPTPRTRIWRYPTWPLP